MLTTNNNRLWELIEESLLLNKEKHFVSHKDVELNYREVSELVNLISIFLSKNKITSICNCCTNPVNFIILQLASIELGISSYLFIPKNLLVNIFDDKFIEHILETSQDTASKKIFKKRPYSFFFNSSGTTSIPHVIENTSQSFSLVCEVIKNYTPMREYLGKYDRFLLCCPLNHSFGFSSLIEMLIYGVHIYFPDSFSIIDIIKAIDSSGEKQINSICASPFIIEKSIQLLRGVFLDKIQHIGMGTDKPSKKLILEIFNHNQNILVSNRYGLTEIPSAIFVSNFKTIQTAMENLYILGEPLSIYKYIICSENKESYELSIQYRSTNKIISTGDCVGYDEQKRLYLIGRTKNTIKYNGLRINTSIVEDIMLQFDMIEDCLLYLRENKLILEYVVPKNVEDQKALIISYWKKMVSAEYYPDLCKKVDFIPRTVTGKKQRR